MSTRKHSSPARAFRPEANDLENRQLLSGVVSGIDSKGDSWTLRLIGPGQLNVLKQNDASGNPASLNSQTDINTITVGGTDPTTSRLVGTVTHAGTNSDGRVFFQNLVELPSRSVQDASSGLGLLSIDMPNFWLGNTTPTGGTTAPAAPSISIPDGVDTLNFGGFDATYNQAAPTSATSVNALVQLGLPLYGGTRILINKSITNTQSYTTPAAGSTPASTSTVQYGVEFAVSGRLNLFQANEIDGNAALPPGQFSKQNSAATGAGGTLVLSSSPGYTQTQTFFTNTADKGGVTGAIGDVRIGGNATNFTTLVFDPTFGGSDRIGNFSVGGETNNVMLIAPSGARNVVFGRGMDNTEILTHVINSLQANRGAINSTVYVDHTISRLDLGGDAINTNVLTGFLQNFANVFNTVVGASTSLFGGGTPATPPVPTSAQPFGGMTVHVAGDVSNSTFVASVEPYQNVFGGPNQIALTGGHITGKIEGSVDNSAATPDSPKTAFFARQVQALAGPVVPPNVPQAPYTGVQPYGSLPGIKSLRPQIPFTPATPTTTTTSSTLTSANQTHAASVTHPRAATGVKTPQGPRNLKTKK